MFGSRSLVWHLTKGAIGVAALIFALSMTTRYPWAPLIGLPVALLAFRGCPMCWTVGLIETVAAKWSGRSLKNACVDGSCSRRSHVGN